MKNSLCVSSHNKFDSLSLMFQSNLLKLYLSFKVPKSAFTLWILDKPFDSVIRIPVSSNLWCHYTVNLIIFPGRSVYIFAIFYCFEGKILLWLSGEPGTHCIARFIPELVTILLTLLLALWFQICTNINDNFINNIC